MAATWLLTMKPTFMSEWQALPSKEAQQIHSKLALLTEDPTPDGKVKKRLEYFEGKICRNFLDNIHPTNPGYEIVREKLWESAGGVNLGPKDAALPTSISGADYGYLRRVRRLFPRVWETRNGASVLNPESATSEPDGLTCAAN